MVQQLLGLQQYSAIELRRLCGRVLVHPFSARPVDGAGRYKDKAFQGFQVQLVEQVFQTVQKYPLISSLATLVGRDSVKYVGDFAVFQAQGGGLAQIGFHPFNSAVIVQGDVTAQADHRPFVLAGQLPGAGAQIASAR